MNMMENYGNIVTQKYGCASVLESVRLDVLFKSEDEYYDIEMQCSGSPDLPLRSRFYSSQLDMEMLKKGQQYNRLAQKYVIFICTFDPMGLNMPV